MFSVVLIPFLALCRRLSQCVCVRVRVCCHESPCAMRSWINTLVPDWQASSSSLRISQAKQANVENIISHTHTHVYKLSPIHWHKNRHILFVLSYQYRHNTKQGQMQLFAQSTQTPTANSAKKKRERNKNIKTSHARREVTQEIAAFWNFFMWSH